jgi:hypothetical protein
LCEESFAPQRDQSPGIEISWMNSPETHGVPNVIRSRKP